MAVTLDGGWLLGAANPPTPKVALQDWSAQSFSAAFTPNADGSLILYFTPRRVDFFGQVGSDNRRGCGATGELPASGPPTASASGT